MGTMGPCLGTSLVVMMGGSWHRGAGQECCPTGVTKPGVHNAEGRPYRTVGAGLSRTKPPPVHHTVTLTPRSGAPETRRSARADRSPMEPACQWATALFVWWSLRWEVHRRAGSLKSVCSVRRGPTGMVFVTGTLPVSHEHCASEDGRVCNWGDSARRGHGHIWGRLWVSGGLLASSRWEPRVPLSPARCPGRPCWRSPQSKGPRAGLQETQTPRHGLSGCASP